MPTVAFTSAKQRRDVAISFLSAVAEGNVAQVMRCAARPGFNPNARAVLESVSWSEPGRPAGAMAIAATRMDSPMIKTLARLGTTLGIDKSGDDPMLLLAESMKAKSVSALGTFLSLYGHANGTCTRPSEAMRMTIMHTRSAKTATAKINLLLAAGASGFYGDDRFGTNAELALVRLGTQPAFAPAVQSIAKEMAAQTARQDNAVRGAMGMLKRG